MRKARFTEEQMVAITSARRIATRCRQSPSGMASASRQSTHGAVGLKIKLAKRLQHQPTAIEPQRAHTEQVRSTPRSDRSRLSL
jgi:hypothetical protein